MDGGSMVKLTLSEQWIVDYMKDRTNASSREEFVSPTEIGKAYGEWLHHGVNVPMTYHSAWASQKCKKLVGYGWLERSKRGHYRLK